MVGGANLYYTFLRPLSPEPESPPVRAFGSPAGAPRIGAGNSQMRVQVVIRSRGTGVARQVQYRLAPPTMPYLGFPVLGPRCWQAVGKGGDTALQGQRAAHTTLRQP